MKKIHKRQKPKNSTKLKKNNDERKMPIKMQENQEFLFQNIKITKKLSFAKNIKEIFVFSQKS
jgi:hypothetical protein